MSPTRISRLFERLRQEERTGFIAYITAGDPAPAMTPRLIAALERGGADLIELGVPFSDPIADGPVIQRGAERALKAGTKVSTVLEIARAIRRQSQIPLLLFTYLNPILRYGLDKLARDAVDAGIDGCLLTDLSVEEAGPYVRAMRDHGLDTVFLAAPTSTAERRALVAEYSTGFIYLVSRTGVTGEQKALGDSAGSLVRSLRQITELPLAVGFGISTKEQMSAAGSIADAVVVGSALVREIEKHGASPDLEKTVELLARELSSGLPSKKP